MELEGNAKPEISLPSCRDPTSDKSLQSRAYQTEMFQHAMRQNIIVAMETGSGKTQIAKLRIEAELERSLPKRVWFCAPSVVLAQQQHTFLSAQLAAYQVRLITGLDNARFWSDQDTWDAALDNIHAVVSTPQILLDALSHGFVSLRQISLLVFDEAHHCVLNAPMAAIMQRFYHPLKDVDPAQLPHVLGLTASPITNKASMLQDLELTMNAVCKTPTLQVQDYKRFVHLPALERIAFDSAQVDPSLVLKKLKIIVQSLRVEDDPAVAWYKGQSHNIFAQQKLEKIIQSGRSQVMKQMDSFLGHAEHISSALGPWCTDLFIKNCVYKLHESTSMQTSLIQCLATDEQDYMNLQLQPIRKAVSHVCNCVPERGMIASKALAVIDYLVTACRPGMTTVIFVKRRSVAHMLTRLLQAYAPTREYQAFSFVGSTNPASRTLTDLADIQQQNLAFADFHNGSRSVCVATQVMEEGVDIQAINLVIRFDEPETFRSFIQSRGRARHPNSKFLLVHPSQDGESVEKLVRWKDLEQAMKKQYSDVLRAAHEAESLEEESESGNEFYRISATGALLTYDNARQHLEHFYTSLPPDTVEDSNHVPFIMSGPLKGPKSACVILPSSIPPPLQAINSLHKWRTEKMAKKDASFQVCKALHTAGLINDNLMPLSYARYRKADIESRDSMYNVHGPINVWQSLVEVSQLRVHSIQITGSNFALPVMLLLMPIQLDGPMSFGLHSAATGEILVCIQPEDVNLNVSTSLARQITSYLFTTVLGRRLKNVDVGNCLPFFLLPKISKGSYEIWFKRIQRTSPVADLVFNDSLGRQSYLLTHNKEEIPYTWTPSFSKVGATRFAPHENLIVERLSRQLSFFQGDSGDVDSDTRSLAVADCKVQGLSPAYADLMLLMPSITFMLELRLRGQLATRHGPLQSVHFSESSLAAQALVSSSASSKFNFERLEYIGDALLKYLATVQVYFDYPLLDEGGLSEKYSALVNNARLQRASQTLQLDQYITTENFSGPSWTLQPTTDNDGSRKMSSKTLADVIEALIAAAHFDKNNDVARDNLPISLLSTVIPEVQWKSPASHVSHYHREVVRPNVNMAKLIEVEDMIGYRFQHKVLLAEALTRASLRVGQQSFQRLEFLGDAVLDRIVNVALYTSQRDMSVGEMKDYRTALVNHWTLAFLAMEMQHTVITNDIETTAAGQTRMGESSRTVRLIDHMRTLSDHAELLQRQRAEETFLKSRDEIVEVLARGSKFPWMTLVGIDTTKAYSDLLESILGAVFIDSHASLATCEGVLEKFGCMKLIRRFTMQSDFDVRQPMQILSDAFPSARKQESSTGKLKDRSREWTCNIVVGGQKVAGFDSSISQKHAETGAATLALDALAS